MCPALHELYAAHDTSVQSWGTEKIAGLMLARKRLRVREDQSHSRDAAEQGRVQV